MGSLNRIFVAVALSLSLAACPKAVRLPERRPVTPLPAVDTSGATVYDVDAQSSELHILVFRGGTLARMGHNHVISSTALSGRAWIHPAFERSGFELSLPVRELIVDDPQARRAAGSDFPPQVPEDAKEGTRKNMLSPALLDAERYPTVTVRSARIGGTPQAPQVTARITIKDVSRDVPVPVTLDTGGGRLTAAGELDILQSDFGIKPFSAALGALEVQDRLHIKLKIVARQSQR